MEREKYLQLIKDRLRQYFDIEEPYHYEHRQFDFYAKSDIRNERYFASKKIKVYAIENIEHVFVQCLDTLTEKELEAFWQVMVKAAEELPEPHEEHMSTIISGIIVLPDGPEENLLPLIRKKKHEKSFMLGLKGWVYIRLIVVNLHQKNLAHNKRGKEVKALYSPVKPDE